MGTRGAAGHLPGPSLGGVCEGQSQCRTHGAALVASTPAASHPTPPALARGPPTAAGRAGPPPSLPGESNRVTAPTPGWPSWGLVLPRPGPSARRAPHCLPLPGPSATAWARPRPAGTWATRSRSCSASTRPSSAVSGTWTSPRSRGTRCVPRPGPQPLLRSGIGPPPPALAPWEGAFRTRRTAGLRPGSPRRSPQPPISHGSPPLAGLPLSLPAPRRAFRGPERGEGRGPGRKRGSRGRRQKSSCLASSLGPALCWTPGRRALRPLLYPCGTGVLASLHRRGN